MMTKIKTYYCLGLFLLFFVTSCEEESHRQVSAEDHIEHSKQEHDQTFELIPSSSEVEWVGSKPLAKHNGIVSFKDGELLFKDEMLKGGEFTVDMHSIVNLDLKGPGNNAKLVNHLKSADFFEVNIYPTSHFVITSSEPISYTQETVVGQTTKELPNYRIKGNLTLRGVSKSITFDALVHLEGDSLWARSVPFSIDRTSWNIKYNSGKMFDNLKDQIIDDQVGLKIDIIARLKKDAPPSDTLKEKDAGE